MKVFKIVGKNESYTVKCEYKEGKSGFIHVATLYRGNTAIAEAKRAYVNRTWERFEYESVLSAIVNDNFSGAVLAEYKKQISALR